MNTENLKSGAVMVHTAIVPHRSNGKEFGLWLRLARADSILPANIINDRSRKRYIGLTEDNKLVVALKTPRNIRSLPKLAEAVQDTSMWSMESNVRNVYWIGQVRLRKEAVHGACMYVQIDIRKRLEDALGPVTEKRMGMSGIWFVPPDWYILELDALSANNRDVAADEMKVAADFLDCQDVQLQETGE